MIFNQMCFSHKAKLFLGYSSQSRDDEKKVLFKMPDTSKHHMFMYILKYMKRLRRQRGLQNDGYALPLFFEKEKRKKKVINALTMLAKALTNTIISHPTR